MQNLADWEPTQLTLLTLKPMELESIGAIFYVGSVITPLGTLPEAGIDLR